MQRDTPATRAAALGLGVSALATVAALYLVWAAFHDIAHGEADLTTEHALLVVSAVWFVSLAMILVRVKHRLLGVVSLVAVGAGLWGQGAVGSDAASLSSRSIAIAGAFLWFVMLAAILGFLSWRALREEHKVAEA